MTRKIKLISSILLLSFFIMGCDTSTSNPTPISEKQEDNQTQNDSENTQNSDEENSSIADVETTSKEDSQKSSSEDEESDDTNDSVETNDNEETCSSILQSELIASTQSLDDSLDLSVSIVNNSKNILTLSQSLLGSGVLADERYIRAMLQLSEDINVMAKNIGDMADKILIMSDKIGDMSERILVTKRKIDENVLLTKSNIDVAQENLNKKLYE